MELDTEIRPVDVHDTLVAAIVGVDEELLPAIGQGFGIDSETMVLGGDVTFARDHARAWDVVAAVTELHLDSAGSSCSGEELVAQADTEDGDDILGDGGRDPLHSLLQDSRVARTVGQEETIVLNSSTRSEVVIPGAHEDLDTPLEEASQLVVFHTDVDAENSHGAPRRVLESRAGGGLVQLGGLDRDCRVVSMNKAGNQSRSFGNLPSATRFFSLGSTQSRVSK